eukprot:1520963-Rhodomonas_salina.1
MRAIEASEELSSEEGESAYVVLLVLFSMVPAFPLLLAMTRRIRNEWVRRTLALAPEDARPSACHASLNTETTSPASIRK